MNYQEKLTQLYRRKNNITTSTFSESVDSLTQSNINENKALKYIRKAMEEVEDNYRRKTIEAAVKVGNHLKEFNCEFRLQGSVTTQTEITQSSDVDLVVITDKAVTIAKGLRNDNPYQGNLTEDLRVLRCQCEEKLRNIYQDVKINGSKSIEVYLTNPKRKVDVVVANWYKTYHFNQTSIEHDKGIYLYDKKQDERIGPDFPFLRSYKIKYHQNREKIRKMVRFMKNFRADFEIQNLTSFQINCIAYDLPYALYYSNEEIEWLKELLDYLPEQGYHQEIDSPCKKEKVRINHNPTLEKVLSKLIEDASYIAYEDAIF